MHGRKMLRAARYLFYSGITLCYFMTGASRRDASAFNHYTIPTSGPFRRSSFSGLLDLLAPGLVGVLPFRLCGTDTVDSLMIMKTASRRCGLMKTPSTRT